jgi:hypothetical protein
MKRILFALALFSLTLPAFGQQAVDPLIGTWKLNAEKSTGSAWHTASRRDLEFHNSRYLLLRRFDWQNPEDVMPK